MKNKNGTDEKIKSDESYFGQNSSQSWSQPVRNDEASQSVKSFYGKVPRNFKHSGERTKVEVPGAVEK